MLQWSLAVTIRYSTKRFFASTLLVIFGLVNVKCGFFDQLFGDFAVQFQAGFGLASVEVSARVFLDGKGGKLKGSVPSIDDVFW